MSRLGKGESVSTYEMLGFARLSPDIGVGTFRACAEVSFISAQNASPCSVCTFMQKWRFFSST